eukprot:11493003-Heterocapsa_arctica.AAC.1
MDPDGVGVSDRVRTLKEEEGAPTPQEEVRQQEVKDPIGMREAEGGSGSRRKRCRERSTGSDSQ